MVTTVVGALPHEREIAQPLRIDLSLVVDLHDAGRSDELGDTVHYGEVTERVAAVVPREQGRPARAPRRSHRRGRRRLRPRRGRRAHRDQAAPADRRARRDDGGQHPPHARRLRRRAHARRTGRSSPSAPTSATARATCAGPLDGLGDIVATSQVFETDPVGGPDDQGAYLNMVVAVDTPLDPFAFVRRCQRIEAAGAAPAHRPLGTAHARRRRAVLRRRHDRLAGADDPAPADRRAPLRARAAGRGRARALPAGLGRRRSRRRPCTPRPAALAVGGPSLELGGPWRGSAPGRTRAAGGRRSPAARRAAPSPSTAGRCTAAGRSGAARRGSCTPASGSGSAPPTATSGGAKPVPGSTMQRCAQPVAVGVGEAGLEELDDHLDRVTSHVLHLARVRAGQERHDDRARRTRRRPATSSSLCMPSAALITVAPASRARRTTSGRQLSMLTSHARARPAPARSPPAAPTPSRQSTTVGDVGRALPAEVDAVGAVGEQPPRPRDRRLRRRRRSSRC